MRIIIGITGASGVIYGIRLLEVLSTVVDVETHLIISKTGELNIEYETDWEVGEVRNMANYCYEVDDCSASLCSGSFRRAGMVVAPCSIKTMSGLANSYADNLILRAGDVTLKEGKKMVLLVRETPLHKGHLQKMEMLADLGAIIMPPVPAFYHRPQTIGEIIDHTIGRVLDVFEIEHQLSLRWRGVPKEIAES